MARKIKKVHMLVVTATMYDGIEFYKTEIIEVDKRNFRKDLINYLLAELDMPELDADIKHRHCNPEAWVYDDDSTAMRFVNRKFLTETEAILYKSLIEF